MAKLWKSSGTIQSCYNIQVTYNTVMLLYRDGPSMLSEHPKIQRYYGRSSLRGSHVGHTVLGTAYCTTNMLREVTVPYWRFQLAHTVQHLGRQIIATLPRSSDVAVRDIRPLTATQHFSPHLQGSHSKTSSSM